MKKIYLVLAVLMVFYFCMKVFAGEINHDNFPDSGATKMIYGDKHVFSVVVPENWVTDEEGQQQSRIPFLIRPDDSDDWNNVYIYALGFDKPENSKENIKTFIKGDIKSYKKNYPGIKIKEVKIKFDNIKNDKLLSGKYYVYEFSEFDNTYKEIVVYIEFPQGVGTIIFSTKSKATYEKYYADFISFSNSFKFIANDINVIDLNQ